MERIHKLENDLIREKDEIEKHRHDIEKLKDDKSREERKNKYAEEEKKSLSDKLKDGETAIEKMKEEKTK